MTKALVVNVKKAAKENDFFRKVLFTGSASQLVLMSLKPEEEIGEEIHTVDQIFYAIEGEGRIVLNGDAEKFEKGFAVFVPAGLKHNVINDEDDEEFKLFTVYAPPQHADGTVHRTKADAIAAEKKELEPAKA